ncbi:MAG: HK97 family phage prohead protease [Blastomonas sp.]|uniref:HK97 family phage prohead protease n=1 Tax=Blastomonas sp. TaxID=1909299 RepID=UPI00259020EC|nr:HK97 family phage prohead protease [Blastomonas sp.]MCO5794023.1 HK97 family phage prohead protease [Blastomonas sp.]
MEYAASPFEIKQLNDAGQIEGIAAGYGNVDHGGDKMLFGSLAKTLAQRGSRPLPMLLHHDLKRPVGAWREWQERPEGLWVKGDLTLATRDAQEAHALAKSGALTGISIGWKPTGSPKYDNGARIIDAAELFEASLVTVPMNDNARVSAIKSIGGPRDIEELFRQAGVSGRKAKGAATAAWRTFNESNDEDEAEAHAAALLRESAARILKGL